MPVNRRGIPVVHGGEDVKNAPDADADTWTLIRIPLTKPGLALPLQLSQSVGDEVEAVILDVETTGIDASTSSIIELGMVRISYSPSARRITSINSAWCGYQDPGVPIPPEITRITGITDEMVQGHQIDDQQVAAFLDGAHMVVAHNAGFDRKHFEKRFPGLGGYAWGCSARGLDWASLGFESAKLDYLLFKMGYFYGAHRAHTDCMALAWGLYVMEEAFGMLLDQVSSVTVIVRAFGSPFGVKDDLKARGYKWDDGTVKGNKHWYTEVPEEYLEAELDALGQLYRNAADLASVTSVTAHSRFK